MRNSRKHQRAGNSSRRTTTSRRGSSAGGHRAASETGRSATSGRRAKAAGGRGAKAAGGHRATGGTRRAAAGKRPAAAGRTGRGGTRSRLARTLVDHDEIRRWAEDRGGKPSAVKGTSRSRQDVGMIRLDFPGYSGEGKLAPIDWDEWFEKFDDSNLALIVQDKTADGEISHFNKLIAREGSPRSRTRKPASREGARRTRPRSGARAQGRAQR